MARASKRRRRLWDTYSFPGFSRKPTVPRNFGDPKARVITLKRRSKKRHAGCCGRVQMGWYDRKVRRVRDLSCGDTRIIRASGSAASRVPPLRQGEAGAARLSGGQPALHQALCLFCRSTLPAGDDQGRGEGTGARLAHGQGAGNAIHASPARARWHARPAGGRDRRDRDPQGPHLPDCGERSGARPTDLVRRRGPFGGEHGPVLQLARCEEEFASSPCGDGHVEALPLGDTDTCAASRDSLC